MTRSMTSSRAPIRVGPTSVGPTRIGARGGGPSRRGRDAVGGEADAGRRGGLGGEAGRCRGVEAAGLLEGLDPEGEDPIVRIVRAGEQAAGQGRAVGLEAERQEGAV